MHLINAWHVRAFIVQVYSWNSWQNFNLVASQIGCYLCGASFDYWVLFSRFSYCLGQAHNRGMSTFVWLSTSSMSQMRLAWQWPFGCGKPLHTDRWDSPTDKQTTRQSIVCLSLSVGLSVRLSHHLRSFCSCHNYMTCPSNCHQQEASNAPFASVLAICD